MIALFAPETLGAYQISVVLPPVLAFVPCAARVQVAPVCVMELTRPAIIPLVEITAIKVLPFTGVEGNVTPKLVATAPPVLPVPKVPTLTGVLGESTVLLPTSLDETEPVPDIVTMSPATKFEMVRSAAFATVVAS